ncbi:Beta-microseminoprotein, partial [Cariama cristata]
CRDSKGQLHEFYSYWRTDNCFDCFCSTDGIDCWSSFVKPVVYDEKCVSIFNKETCTYKVVEKADHSKECPVYQRVG